jgi:hypothetical protein
MNRRFFTAGLKRPSPLGATTVLVFVALAACISAAPADAHLGQDQFGRFPFVVDGRVVGGGTSWGLVLPDEVFGGFGRVCEESFGPAVTFALDQPAQGRVLLGGIQGLEVTTDGGCSWSVIDNDLNGAFPNGIWRDPNDPDHLIIGTSTISANNGVWRSRDGGDTVTQLIAPRVGNFFSIAASDDGVHIAVGGNNGQSAVLLLMSDDAGETFVDVSASVDERIIVTPLAYDGSALILGGLDPSTQGFIDRVVIDGDVATVTPVGTTPRQTTHAVVFGGDVFTVARNGARGELYRENDSALGFGVVAGGPSECLYLDDGGTGLLGCGKQGSLETGLFMRSADGVTWVEEIAFLDVHYRACPDGTVGQSACSSFIETFCGDGIDDDFDGATDCEDDDCAFNPLCVSGEGEGEGGEGEGEGREGEGEGDDVVGASCCTGSPSGAVAYGAIPLLLLRLRRRR